ncbi:hypothetical protein GCM10008967_34930 [Bacillus carboniphilus]|uniref:YgaB-like protein n=1 Tax=Bacillus carboniphilus TaxID=86663 RepID=A0ABN0WLZ9_9BACI
MKMFDELVNNQMKTMDQLLFLQSELERCQKIEAELLLLEEEARLAGVREDIEKMKQELREIQETFEKQTEQVIRYYQEENLKQYSV